MGRILYCALRCGLLIIVIACSVTFRSLLSASGSVLSFFGDILQKQSSPSVGIISGSCVLGISGDLISSFLARIFTGSVWILGPTVVGPYRPLKSGYIRLLSGEK